MATTHSKYKSKNKWEKLSTENKLMSYLGREKNLRKLREFTLQMKIFALRKQIGHDLMMLKELRKCFPKEYENILNKVGKLKNRKQIQLEYIKLQNPKGYIGRKMRKLKLNIVKE